NQNRQCGRFNPSVFPTHNDLLWSRVLGAVQKLICPRGQDNKAVDTLQHDKVGSATMSTTVLHLFCGVNLTAIYSYPDWSQKSNSERTLVTNLLNGAGDVGKRRIGI